MEHKKSKNSKPRNTDPRLKSFLRKAAAIISAEKGLNAESRLKLQTLAKHVKLPQPLFEEALARLQHGIDASLSLTRYEKAFIKFLDTEFEKITGDIISPRVENEAIGLAKRKYDISSLRAEKLIAARAKAAGMSLISRLEAETFADQLIAERIGEQTVIAEELTSQIHKIGKKWGLESSEIERIVNRVISQNKAEQKRPIRQFLAILVVVTLITIALFGSAFAVGWFPQNWIWKNKNYKDKSPENPIAIDTIESSRFPVSVATKLEELQRSRNQLGQTIEQITDEDLSLRRAGYQELVQTACLDQGSDRQLRLTLACELYYADPDEESAMEIVATIEDFLEILPGQLPSVQDLKDIFQVNDLIGMLILYRPDFKNDTATRKAVIEQLIESFVFIPLESFDSLKVYRQLSEVAIATDQWNRVIQSAWNSPVQAAVLLQPLYELTQPKLNPQEIDGFRDDALLAIIESDASRWRVLQEQIRHSVESCDDAKLIAWVAVFRNCTDGRLRDLLAEAILPRIDIRPASRSREDIAIAIANFELQNRNRALLPLIIRNERLEKLHATLLKDDSINRETGVTADRIAKLAQATNKEWAFCAAIENATHIDESTFAEFDRLIATPLPRLRELVMLPIDRRNANRTGPASATASDRRRMNNALNRLRDQEPALSGARSLALKQIKQVAHRFERISYSDAETLSRYLLSDLAVEELLNVEKLIESFAHWPNLALAMADQIVDSNVKADQVLTLLRLLLNWEIELEDSADWKRDLQIRIIAAVSVDVDNQANQDPDNIKNNWIRLKIYLSDLYNDRLAFVDNRSQVKNENLLPHRASMRLVELAAKSPDSSGTMSNIGRAVQLIDKLPANEIEKTAFSNQLLIKTLLRELSGASTKAELLLEDMSSNLSGNSLAGDQLYTTELSLLKVITLKRKLMVSRLLKLDEQP